MTQQAGIFGYPLAHSVSPAFQQAAFDHYSLPVRYRLWATPPKGLADAVSSLRLDAYLGANVTVPHKERVSEFLDGIDSWAASVGAVNTIAKEDGRLIGYNTDTYGFLTSLTEKASFAPAGANVLLLGAGGTARAAAFALASHATSRLIIANRTLRRAQTLAQTVAKVMPSVEAISLRRSDLAEAASGADLIVNSTSMGMSHGDADGATPMVADLIPAGILVYDMVYNPPETPLLREARKANARTMGGLWMLIYQGAAAFERWTGRKAPLEVMYAAAQRALAA